MAIKPVLKHTFFKNDGTRNAGGKLYTYVAGTSTPVTTYTTSAADVANTNPIILDSHGECELWVSSQFKANLLESDDTQVTGWPVDNLGSTSSSTTGSTSAVWGGTASGTANALAIAPSTAISAYAVGQSVIFKAGAADNTSTTTIAISGLSPIAVQVNGAACAGGEILANMFYLGVLDTLTTCQISKIGRVLLSELGLATTDSPQFAGINIGHATDTTLTRASAGKVAVEGVTLADLGANTFTGTQTMSGKSIIEANASVAAHATTMDPWLGGNYVTLTGGAVTFTALANAPQAGAEVELYMNAAHVFTDGAVFEVDGNQNWTAEVGDRVLLRAKSTTVFTVHPRKADGTAVVTAGGVGNHCVTVHTGNGYGSTNTAIPRYTTAMVNVGTAITYADSATLGASFTINEPGIYAVYIAYADGATGSQFGASLNSTQLTSNIASVNIADRVIYSKAASIPQTAFAVVRAVATDVIRPHIQAATSMTVNDTVVFSVRKVGTE